MKGRGTRDEGQGSLFKVKIFRRKANIADKKPHTLIPLYPHTLILILLLLLSCTRTPQNIVTTYEIETKARPFAIVHTGEHPLWFLLTPNGPIHIESIEDAIAISSHEPWPLALHIRFFHNRGEDIVMAVNRGGFVKITPEENGLGLYYFSGGLMWRKYTVGGFFNFNDQDTAVLYLDDRFKESNEPLPDPRAWSFNMESNSIFAVNIPALETFPAYNGWDVNILRQGGDNLWYYRIIKKLGTPDIRYLRTENLSQAGIAINIDDFFNSAPRKEEIDYSFLPALPNGFVYTGVNKAGGSIAAYWEEQNDYSIGAAGFMLVRE